MKKAPKNLIIVWSMDIHWRNLWGSGLLEVLSKSFEKILVIGPRELPPHSLPKNVVSIRNRWLVIDPLLAKMAHLLRFYFFAWFPQLSEYRRERYKVDYPKSYLFGCWFGPIWIRLFHFCLWIRSWIADAFLWNYRDSVLLTNTFIWESYDGVLGMWAKRRGVRWVSMVTSWDNPASKGRFMLQPPEALVWGELNRRQVEYFQGLPKKDIRALTPPHFYRMIEISKEPEVANKHLVYICGTKFNYVFERDFVNLLIETLRKIGFLDQRKLIIRPHPNDLESWKEFVSREKNVELDPDSLKRTSQWTVFSTEGLGLDNYYRLLKNAYAVISHYSTATVEAGLFGVAAVIPRIEFYSHPDFQLISDGFDHWRRLKNSPGILFVDKNEQLQPTLERILNGLPPEVLQKHKEECEDVARFPTETLFQEYADYLKHV